jgi:hypothetical protein
VIESQQVLEWQRQSAVKTAREILRTLLEDRFGPLPKKLLQRIEATDDLERLREAVRQVHRLQKLDDLQL